MELCGLLIIRHIRELALIKRAEYSVATELSLTSVRASYRREGIAIEYTIATPRLKAIG